MASRFGINNLAKIRLALFLKLTLFMYTKFLSELRQNQMAKAIKG